MALSRQQSAEIRLNRHLSVTTTTMTTPFTRAVVHHSRPPPVPPVATPSAAVAANQRIPAVVQERAPPVVRPSVLRLPQGHHQGHNRGHNEGQALIQPLVANCEQKREIIEKWKQISETNNSSQILSRVLRQKPSSRDIPEMLSFPHRHVTSRRCPPIVTISPLLTALAPEADVRPQNLNNGHVNRAPTTCHVTPQNPFVLNTSNHRMNATMNRNSVPFSPLLERKSPQNRSSPEMTSIDAKNAPTINGNNSVVNNNTSRQQLPFVSTFSPVLTQVSPLLMTKTSEASSVATPVARDLNNNRVLGRKSPEIVILDDESRDSSQESEKSLKIDLKFDEKEEKVFEKQVFEEKDDKKEQKEFDEEFEGFMKEFIQHLIESKKYIEEKEKKDRKSPEVEPTVTSGQGVERVLSHATESEFVLCLDLISSRELRRKPIAYLNAKYPKNEISRSVYAGIRTKRAVMDFPKQLAPSSAPFGEREAKRRRFSLRPTTPSSTTSDDTTTAETTADKWSSVLSCLDFSSPLSRRIVAVLPHFQHKD